MKQTPHTLTPFEAQERIKASPLDAKDVIIQLRPWLNSTCVRVGPFTSKAHLPHAANFLCVLSCQAPDQVGFFIDTLLDLNIPTHRIVSILHAASYDYPATLDLGLSKMCAWSGSTARKTLSSLCGIGIRRVLSDEDYSILGRIWGHRDAHEIVQRDETFISDAEHVDLSPLGMVFAETERALRPRRALHQKQDVPTATARLLGLLDWAESFGFDLDAPCATVLECNGTHRRLNLMGLASRLFSAGAERGVLVSEIIATHRITRTEQTLDDICVDLKLRDTLAQSDVIAAAQRRHALQKIALRDQVAPVQRSDQQPKM